MNKPPINFFTKPILDIAYTADPTPNPTIGPSIPPNLKLFFRNCDVLIPVTVANPAGSNELAKFCIKTSLLALPLPSSTCSSPKVVPITFIAPFNVPFICIAPAVIAPNIGAMIGPTPAFLAINVDTPNTVAP